MSSTVSPRKLEKNPFLGGWDGVSCQTMLTVTFHYPFSVPESGEENNLTLPLFFLMGSAVVEDIKLD